MTVENLAWLLFAILANLSLANVYKLPQLISKAKPPQRYSNMMAWSRNYIPVWKEPSLRLFSSQFWCKFSSVFRWSHALLFHQSCVDFLRSLILIPLSVSILRCKAIHSCNILETSFLLLVTASTVSNSFCLVAYYVSCYAMLLLFMWLHRLPRWLYT